MVIKKYYELKNIENVGNYFNVSYTPIKRILIENNIEIPLRKYSINENYFNTIDSSEKAYWLGFLYADGYVRKRIGTGDELKFKLHNKDIYILEKFKKCLNSNHPLKLEKNTNCSVINIGSEKIVNDLIKHGCVNRKSLILKFPNNLNEKLYNSFILGYFDGDGTVGYYPHSRTYSAGLMGTKNMMDNIKEILFNNNIITSIHKNKKQYNILITKINNILLFMNYIYENNNIFLERKRNIFERIKLHYLDNKKHFLHSSQDILKEQLNI